MNKKQWYALAITFYLLMFFFMQLDMRHGYILVKDPCLEGQTMENKIAENILDKVDKSEITLDEGLKQIGELRQIDELDIHCAIRGEVYAPFLWLFMVLGIVCNICASLEPKK